MLSNLIHETTTTDDTGDLTLAGAATVNGFLMNTFASQYAINEPFSYIVRASNGDYEVGVGNLSGSTTLVRGYVIETRVSGTIDRQAPTAIDLPVGTHQVGISPIAQGIRPARNGKSTNGPRITNGHMFNGNPTGTTTVVADKLYLFPVIFEGQADIDALICNILTANGIGSDVFRMGIYSTDPATGEAGPLLAETGDGDPSTTGMKTLSITRQVFNPGPYYLGFLCEVTPGLRGTSWTSMLEPRLGGPSGNLGWYIHQTDNITPGWSTMPDPTSPGHEQSGGAPFLLGARLAS